MVVGMERDLAESRAHLAELSAANAALRRANSELETSRAALVDSEARLRLALDAARMATWEWDFVGDSTWGSPGREALYGRPSGSLRTRADVLSAVHPDDRAMSADTILRAMRRAPGEDDFDAVEFRVTDPDGTVRWLRSQCRVTARDPESGQARRAAGVTFDVTARRVAELAAESALAELRAVYDTVPVGLALLDREGRLLNLNARLAAVLGVPQSLPPAQALEEVLPAAVLDEVRAALRRVVASGAAATGIEAACAHSAAGPGDSRCWAVCLQPVLAEAPRGTVRAVSLMLEDVTERRRAAAKRDLLAREVDHRARNALAMVQAAVRLTRAGSVADFARAQTMLAERQRSGAGLLALARAALSVFTHGEPTERVCFGGPAVTLAAAAVQPLSMALHELATNATKYGALSVQDGHVALDWTLDRLAGVLRLRWAESGGPRIAGAPQRRGFGARVLDATVRDQLGGRVELGWGPSGLVCDMALPMGRAVA